MSSADDVSLFPAEGWHCRHLYYRFNRRALRDLAPGELVAGREQFLAVLAPDGPHAPARLQPSIVAGHKADFSLMLLDPDPQRVRRLEAREIEPGIFEAVVATDTLIKPSGVERELPVRSC